MKSHPPTPNLSICNIAVVVTLGFPEVMKHWTNEQVLNFIHVMYEKSSEEESSQSDLEKELDPLNFLPESTDTKSQNGPLEASVVVEIARKAYEALIANGVDIFSRRKPSEPSFGSPLAGDTIMIETLPNASTKSDNPLTSIDVSTNGDGLPTSGIEHMPTIQARSFVAAPESTSNNKTEMPDPARKQRIVEWLCSNIQHLNELSELPFSSRELWRLHQHYFTPVVNESGGSVLPGAGNRIVSSVPEVSRGYPGSSAVTPSTQSSDEQLLVPVSDPAMQGSPRSPAAPASLPMLKRKVSYRFMGDAIANSQTRVDCRNDCIHKNGSVAKLIEDGHTGHSMPPKTKKARRNRTRISFVPRIKAKLDSYLDVNHEKALVTMRQLYFVEQAILGGQVNPLEPSQSQRTHLGSLLASEAEMIIVDMI